MESRIGKKIFGSYLILILITVIIVGSLLSPLLRNYLINNKKNELLSKATEIGELASEVDNIQLHRLSLDIFIENIDSSLGTRFRIIDKRVLMMGGEPLSRAMPRRSIDLNRDEVSQILAGNSIVRQGISADGDIAVISVIVPIFTVNFQGEKEVSGAVLAISPVYLVHEALKTAYFYLVLSSLVAIIVATFIAMYFSRKITLPLKNMNKVALTMAQGNYDMEINVESKDELGELATSLNFLARQLNSNVKALEEEKIKLESIVLSINEGLIAVNRKGEVVLVNPVTEKIFVVNSSKLVGQQLKNISPIPQLASVYREAMDRNQIIWRIFAYKNTSYKVVVSPITQENGGILGAVGIIRDISEMEKVEQLRSNFIANVSHELRAPITVIRGYINCLLDGVIDTTPNHYYGIIRDETIRMEKLIKELMDLSLLQSGKVQLYFEDVDLNLLLQGIINKYLPLAREKNIEISLEDKSQSGKAYCDGDRIEQLLIILIDNALKFTPDGGKIQIALMENKEKIIIKIKDNGLGIPEDELPLIWERFYKVDKSRKRDGQEGTGLGLSIAKQIAEIHRAELAVVSELGQGSLFALKLNK